MTLLLATDIRVAAEHATFGLAEVKRGIIAGNGGTQRVLQQLPYAIAMEMLLTGDGIDAVDGRALGPGQQGGAAWPTCWRPAYAYARKIAANAPLAVQAAKELAVRSRDMDLTSGLRLESGAQSHAHGHRGRQGRPGSLFRQKRKPEFKGN
jgi:E-phenylitaconyl-CoA hydratase